MMLARAPSRGGGLGIVLRIVLRTMQGAVLGTLFWARLCTVVGTEEFGGVRDSVRTVSGTRPGIVLGTGFGGLG